MAAPRVSPNPEVQKHYAAQFALSTALAAALRRLWPTLDRRDVASSLPVYKRAVTAVVDHFGSASSALALDHFQAMRDTAGVSEPFSPPLVDVMPAEKVQASLGWATSDLTITGGDAEVHEPAGDTLTITFDRVEAASQKLVADAGRNELIEAIEADRHARGWVRVTRPDACAFCRVLATRPILATSGEFYRSSGTAGRNANARFVGEGDFKFHDNCHCTIEPVFSSHYEAPAHTRADAALWQDATAGFSGNEALNAFRRAVEAQRRSA